MSTTTNVPRAKFGADAQKEFKGKLPLPFPRTIGPNTMKYLQEVVDSGLTTDIVTRFETTFARRMGMKHCIGTPGCTAALSVLAAAMELAPGDEIICSPITDYGTVLGFVRENYIPVFADTAPGSINLDAKTIEAKITDRTRAIIAVHKTGLVCDMDPIMALARRHKLLVIEDVCQATFSTYKGKLAGTIGDAAAFSFDSEKTVGSDIGGCVVTNDDKLAEAGRFHGQSRAGEMRQNFGRIHTAAGYPYRMPMATAAITLAQLEIADENVAHRDRMIRLLTKQLAGVRGITPLAIPSYQEVYSCWMAGFNIDLKQFKCSADEFAAQMVEAGIAGAGTGRYYLMPAALPVLEKAASAARYPFCPPATTKKHSYSADNCPNARDFLESFIRWSTFNERYQPEHCELVAQIVSGIAERNRK
jgi:dTDP-4-amino-4,6-dideoxygalactose transaminase